MLWVGLWVGIVRGCQYHRDDNELAEFSACIKVAAGTSIGAILGCTMREYVQLPLGRDVFEKTDSEALNVVLALGEQPETMLVEPIPRSRTGSGDTSQAYDGWFQQILDNYGGTKPAMLQDFESGRSTEIDFVNGYVVGLGKQNGMNVVFNEVMVAIVKEIAGGDSRPSADHLNAIIARSFLK